LLPADVAIDFDFDFLAQPGALDRARADTEELRNGTLTLAEARNRRGRRKLDDSEIEFWDEHYHASKSVAESFSESVAQSITVTN
ncbi:hypothetical protein ACTGXY_11360, partial [Streptococcus suis]